MPIISSCYCCCYWKSLKKGSYVSAFYSLIYFTISTISITIYLYDERHYLMGSVDMPTTKSFLGATLLNLWFSMLLLVCSFMGAMTSILLIIGLKRNSQMLLIPFIIVMSLDIFLAILHFFIINVFGDSKFDPITGILFTMDFFMISLNFYCLVCIISKYQEYDEYEYEKSQCKIKNRVVCETVVPEKSCIVLHPIKTSIKNVNEVKMKDFTIQPKRTAKFIKKRVNFTDELRSCSNILSSIVNDKSLDKDEALINNEIKDSSELN